MNDYDTIAILSMCAVYIIPILFVIYWIKLVNAIVKYLKRH